MSSRTTKPTHQGAGIKNLNFPGTSSVSKARFTEFLIRENALDGGGFKEWIFCPGMLFNAPDKWWGDQGKRDRPHEGLDLCFYRDRRDRVLRVDTKTRIPVMYGGEVIGIVNDFLGKSVIIEHGFTHSDDRRLCTIYGHTNPHEGLHVGRIVKEGEIIATLADSGKSEANMFPHLHISLGWTSKSISYDQLDWKTIGAQNMLTLLDPLDVMDWPYQVLEDVSPSRLA
jgi:murein DD-endopeptidase MepM/ murein hydrolase activator NlpD